ncbi:MAG: glutamine--tRNA ligase/YqeY domain fusion protein [Pseudomonadales bacterium]|jgi:glutaminyl-tRNA synthetase|nr:glutamine--tRNA ligase/YqeY domain fusion protein [Pseudomonadales bacterium]MDP6470583.1 glutamine--tRNA ligase/YqeY domain fusion protein [Pseudomonadales bacterium]MDP6828562.1 glutamine--tRNA ligase/YqeY domain fusion protein [Pseudomonadales bacterium]MDP6971872.1 glutamine--tRNA ligase/YqeY domain fusion protein [Pseudomonadales bacterium]
MTEEANDFIRQRIQRDLDEDTLGGSLVVTRFPPEPNGYLHIGHAKSICLNFGVAREYGGYTYLRFDDTNPLKEDQEYVEAIKEDVRWLGFDFEGHETHASDYFEQLYKFAVELVEEGKAYVCSLSGEEIRASRGTLTEPGRESPYRKRGVAENLDLFARMRAGEFGDGRHVLRAKIDMTSPNLNMRDPVLYRIRHATHQRTADDWVIYPMYDFTHCICDALEGITHSLCTLEFEDHRPLYDWVLDNINVNFHPPQIEFSRLGLEYTVMSKRLLHTLVEDGYVAGWDDPRMPTLAGLRRRGVTPGAIAEFCRRIGVTKQDNTVEMNLLEFCIRQDLESNAPRGMGVVDPLKITIVNYAGDGELLVGPWHQQNVDLGTRELPFGAELYIERDDFAEVPPKKFKRLSPGQMVRLRYAYIIRCDEVITDEDGEVVELRCSYFPDSRSGSDTSGLKPKGVIHWAHAQRSVAAEMRLYDRLFRVPQPGAGTLADDLNPDSLRVARGFVEPAVAASEHSRFQFERTGYFCKDAQSGDALVFNRTVTLRDSWKPDRG